MFRVIVVLRGVRPGSRFYRQARDNPATTPGGTTLRTYSADLRTAAARPKCAVSNAKYAGAAHRARVLPRGVGRLDITLGDPRVEPSSDFRPGCSSRMAVDRRGLAGPGPRAISLCPSGGSPEPIGMSIETVICAAFLETTHCRV